MKTINQLQNAKSNYEILRRTNPFIISHSFKSNVFKLEYKKLSSCDLDTKLLAAHWCEKKWGFMRNFPGLEWRLKQVTKYANFIHIAFYAGQPIGMFLLYQHTDDFKGYKHLMLDGLYVIEALKSLGIGTRLIRHIKKQYLDENTLIHLDTVTPNLTAFYTKGKARCVIEYKITTEGIIDCYASRYIFSKPIAKAITT